MSNMTNNCLFLTTKAVMTTLDDRLTLIICCEDIISLIRNGGLTLLIYFSPLTPTNLS